MARQEKVYVTPAAMKEKFKRLADILKKRASESSSALKKLFPEGLKMRWTVDKWETAGMMVMDSKGGTSEIKIELK